MFPNDYQEGKKTAPPVWYWYVLLCALIALANVGLAILGFWFLSNEQEIARQANYPPEIVHLEGLFFVICGIVFAIGNIVLPFLPKKPWIYVLHMTNIVAAGLSCCLLPLAIPLFIGWLKPQARDFFEFR